MASRIGLSWSVLNRPHNATCDCDLGIAKETTTTMRSIAGHASSGRRFVLAFCTISREVFSAGISLIVDTEGVNHPGRHAQRLRNDALASRDWRRTTRRLLRTRCTINYHRWRRRGESERQRNGKGERKRTSAWTDRHWQSAGTLGAYFKTTVLPTRKRRRPSYSDTIPCNLLWLRCWWIVAGIGIEWISFFFFLFFSLYGDMQICEGDWFPTCESSRKCTQHLKFFNRYLTFKQL